MSNLTCEKCGRKFKRIQGLGNHTKWCKGTNQKQYILLVDDEHCATGDEDYIMDTLKASLNNGDIVIDDEGPDPTVQVYEIAKEITIEYDTKVSVKMVK